jgi:hypothetical protein
MRLNSGRWMHLEAKRLTTKYRASKMFCSHLLKRDLFSV